MENQILYGKDIASGEITRLQCIGNVLATTNQDPVLELNDLSNVDIGGIANKDIIMYDSSSSKWKNVTSKKDYITVNMYGHLNTTTFDNTSALRKIITSSESYWSTSGGAVPDPLLNIQADYTGNNIAYNPLFGLIENLNASKLYLINVVVNINNVEIAGSSVALWEISLRNASGWTSELNSGYGSALSPSCTCVAQQRNDFSGTGLVLTRVITGIISFGLTLRTTNSVDIITTLNDTNLSISVIEI